MPSSAAWRLLVGLPGVVVALWLGIVSGGIVAIALLLLRRKGLRPTLPFGPFLAGGAMVVLLVETELISWDQDFARG